MWQQVYLVAVLFGGLALLMALAVGGRSIFVVAPLCAALTVGLSGGNPIEALTGPYMAGFAGYLRDFYFVFALGAAFGKLYETSGAAATIARHVGRRLGTERACLAVVLAAAILTYGGVSLFVVGFAVHPLAVRLFCEANLPRRFIPAAIAFGSITFTMTSAGSPEIQNLIPIRYLVDEATGQPLTDAAAGWPASLIVAGCMFAAGQWYLQTALRRAARQGEAWTEAPDARGAPSSQTDERSFAAAALPLVATVLALNALPRACHALAALRAPEPDGSRAAQWLQQALAGFPADPALSIFLGVVVALGVLRPGPRQAWGMLGEGFTLGLLAIGATSSVVGFGAAIKDLAAFQQVVDWVTRIGGDPLIGAAIAVAVISALAGSASGGQGIALPILKPIFIDELGVAPRALHRVVAIASGSLDSLPANGYVVTLIRNICGETHQRAYGPIFVLTVVIPCLGAALAIALFKLVPSWANS